MHELFYFYYIVSFSNDFLNVLRTWFERISMLVILLNCVTLGMYQPCVDDQCITNRCKILQVSFHNNLYPLKIKIVNFSTVIFNCLIYNPDPDSHLLLLRTYHYKFNPSKLKIINSKDN